MEKSQLGVSVPVVLFDGVCNLCNGSVQFIIRRDPRSSFRFAALQSDFGKRTLQESGIPQVEMNSIILVVGQKYFHKSDAALEIVRRLPGLWPALYVFKIIPRFLRDSVYDLVARNRYKMFGRRESCMIPTPELKARFVQ